MPNTRIQELLTLTPNEQDIVKCQYALGQSLNYVDTFRCITGGSETLVVDCNLQAMLNIMAGFSQGNLQCSKINNVTGSMYLAYSASPEHGLQVSGRALPSSQVVVGSEVKGVEASVRKCYPQLISVCGSSCIELHRLGLAREDAVVVGIVMAGACCQFCAAYLLNKNFPVLVALSPELCLFGTFGEQRAVAEWCLRVVSFSCVTAGKLLFDRGESLQHIGVCLDISTSFAKPVRNGWKSPHQRHDESAGDGVARLVSQRSIRLNHIMRIYEQVRLSGKDSRTPDPSTVVLFPEGVVSVPGDGIRECDDLRSMLIAVCIRDGFGGLDLCHCPLILFPRLSPEDGWRNDKPSPAQRERYLEQLHIANAVLNSAQVAHLDERPANIMWREVDGEEFVKIELRLIDFEDAVRFNHVISSDFVAAVVRSNDLRYPFKSGDEATPQLAGPLHNSFFYEAVSQWTLSDEVEFGEFMKGAGADILGALE